MIGREWKPGDRLYHAGCPEWGTGEVRGAVSVSQNGVKCQRLTISFDRAGTKTLSTAFADLRTRDSREIRNEPSMSEPRDPLAAATEPNHEEALVRVPEDATDPFRPHKARLHTTLGLYRFTSAGASLLDWAASQTGMKDPLSKFSRHELERSFDRFRANLDAHLKKLAFEMRKADPASLAEAVASAGPEQRQALRRADAGR
jgi:hypothetical protein